MDAVRSSTTAYLGGLTLLTIALLGTALRIGSLPGEGELLLAVLLSVCTALAIAVPIHVGAQQKLTLFGGAIFAGVLLLEPGIAIGSVGVGTMVGQLVRQVPWIEALFNVLQTMLQTAAGGFVLWWGNWNFERLAIVDVSVVPVVLVSLLAIEAVNNVLVAGIMAVESSESFGSAVRAVVPRDVVAMADPALPFCRSAIGGVNCAASHAHPRAGPLPLLRPS